MSTMTAERVAASGDLLIEILRRLPSKSVGRFRCVSKKWLSILTDPNFRRLHHLSLHPRTTAIFLFRRASHHYTYLDLVSLAPHDHHNLNPILDKLSEFHKDGAEIINIHSCKGLMCVHTYINPTLENQSVGNQNRIYVYNPLTFESRLIPKLNTKELRYGIVGVYMVFEPLSDCYNIVCAWERGILGNNVEIRDPRFARERDIVMFSFYSSKTGDWCDSRGVLVIRKRDIEFQQGVVWKGNVHWFGWRRNLVCLDVGKKCCRAMPKPLHFGVTRFWYFGESGGKLYLVGNRDDTMSLDVLELDENYIEWTVKHHVDMSSFLNTKWFMGRCWDDPQPRPNRPNEHEMYRILGFNVLCFVIDYRDGLEKLVISVRDKIVLYDINRMEIEEIAKINPLKSTMVKKDVFEFKWFHAHQFIKTHVSL